MTNSILKFNNPKSLVGLKHTAVWGKVIGRQAFKPFCHGSPKIFCIPFGLPNFFFIRAWCIVVITKIVKYWMRDYLFVLRSLNIIQINGLFYLSQFKINIWCCWLNYNVTYLYGNNILKISSLFIKQNCQWQNHPPKSTSKNGAILLFLLWLFTLAEIWSSI